MRLLFIFLVFICGSMSAQELSGTLIDDKTGEPIMNATVYLDGTSVGTVSDINGNFKFSKPPEIKADLIISIIGFEKIRISEPLKSDLSKIKLVKKTNVLNEIVLELDPWSRKKKVRYFKDQFLGTVSESRKCRILNLDKIRLRFNPSSNLLTAVCEEPIVIINEHLGYKIYYDLSDFEIKFNSYYKESEDVTKRATTRSKEYIMEGTFFMGSSFFQELEGDKPSKDKRLRRREKAYELSDLRFYRALAIDQFKEQGYSLFRNKQPVPVAVHVRVNQLKNFSRVNFRYKRYDFLINKKHQSFFIVNSETIIDQFGNNITGKSITFGGYISRIKISGLLPLNYGL